ncbi:hypothetical protein EV193_103409 [Herbihabitans rhizosphaerae]|uniref:Secreted protein n=1 Tax=Herbihabitans rhizosphaerae TaxID=1872711 RepID=A0A4Q7KYG1_9PSEU|nr:hypothetical protein [Herbihabitans rhizosphaerae]RZS41091.1 hypothetical protein EV193_103409 [Herbihabitans rhizosphaerae]
MFEFRRIAITTAACVGLVGLPATAQADEVTVGAAWLGSATIVTGSTVEQGPIARCGTDTDVSSGQSAGVTVGTTTKYGRGTTTCGRDAEGMSKGAADGKRFETTVLRQFGGPTIKISGYGVSCWTRPAGSSSSMYLEGVSGFDAPQDIPSNHLVVIPGGSGQPPAAHVVLNELTVPSPPDGSMVVHAAHIKLFPEGGPASGDIYVGSAACDPHAG